jgi:hypothetical protein
MNLLCIKTDAYSNDQDLPFAAMKPPRHILLTLVSLLSLHLALPAQENWESGGFFFDLIRPADLRGYHQLELRDSASSAWPRRGRWHNYRCFTLDTAGRPVSDVHWRYFNHKELESADTTLYPYAPDGTYQRHRTHLQAPAPNAYPGTWATFDEAGRIKGIRMFDHHGWLYWEETYTWTPDNLRFTCIIRRTFRGQNGIPDMSSTVSDYDTLGRLVTLTHTTSYSAHRTTLSYQDRLVTAVGENLYSHRDPINKVLVYLDENGLPTRAEGYHQYSKKKWELDSHLTFRYVR